MSEYLVTWRIDVDADTPEQAARTAREIQLDPESIAHVFSVIRHGDRLSTEVDLDELDYKQETATCHHCDREIVNDPTDGWVDPQATGDDSVWRETCDENLEDRIAAHEPI